MPGKGTTSMSDKGDGHGRARLLYIKKKGAHPCPSPGMWLDLLRFDERGVETKHGGLLGHWRTKGPVNMQGRA
jgi:hypothetical protein